MRTVAAYSLTRSVSETQKAFQDLDAYSTRVEEWLRGKGADDVSLGQRDVVLSRGRVAHLTREHIETSHGTLASFVLNEPIDDGKFETHIDLAQFEIDLVLSCRLGTVSTDPALTPVSFEAHCPRIVRDLIQEDSWASGTGQVSIKNFRCSGHEAGQRLADAIWHVDRGLPIVVISERFGQTLHPSLASNLAFDLTGLATIVEIDSDASWTMSKTKGSIWSCYDGAIRIYWPFSSARNHPNLHPFWIHRELIPVGVSIDKAADRIRHRIKRMVFEQSAFQTMPLLISKIRQLHRDVQRAQARDADAYEEIAEDYGQENDYLRRENTRLSDMIESRDDKIESLNDRIAELEDQKRALTDSRAWTQKVHSSDDQEYETSPPTVEDAVQRAKRDCEHLIFGNDVQRGIDSLATDAGPPSKILRYLCKLDEMTSQVQGGELGMPIRQWLREQNIAYSPEQDNISAKDRESRTWNDSSGSKRLFLDHLKPNDGTSPDRCVRIYFCHDEQLSKTIIGWVGRHP